jgi:hypothetical protein
MIMCTACPGGTGPVNYTNSCADGGSEACSLPPGVTQDDGYFYSKNRWGECSTNLECTAHASGRCGVDGYSYIGRTHGYRTKCFYDECSTDADCPTGTLCQCGKPGETIATVNRCVPADCRVDADCGAHLCTPTSIACGESTVAYHCTTGNDACVPEVGESGDVCVFSDHSWGLIGEGCQL